MSIDKYWIKELQNGNHEAFEIIYDKYHKLVFYIINHITNDKEASKELVQDTFLKVWNNAKSFKINTNFKSWLSTIAKNTAIDYKRTKKDYSVLDVDLESDSKSPTILSEYSMDARMVLTKLEYDVVVLTIIYNLKRREVAEILEKPIGTITRVYMTAIKKLKKFYSWSDKLKIYHFFE